MSDQDVILTGLPRSGTTLACALLNKLPDTVALHEPMQGMDLGDVSQPRRLALDVKQFCAEQRRSIREQGRALSRHIDGTVPDNPFGAGLSAKGVRQQIDVLGEIAIHKPLSEHFMLVVKHTSRFVPLISPLSEILPVYALIRNPLPTLASWGTVSTGIRRGRTGPAGRIDAGLDPRVDAFASDLDRQIALLDWYFEQFLTYLAAGSVIRYEDLVASGGRALRVINPKAEQLSEPLESRNLNTLYGSERLLRIGERLLQRQGAFWDFYTKEGVEALMDEAVQAAAT